MTVNVLNSCFPFSYRIFKNIVIICGEIQVNHHGMTYYSKMPFNRSNLSTNLL